MIKKKMFIIGAINILIIAIISAGLHYHYRQALKLVTIYRAKREINPFERITADMLEQYQVPLAYVDDQVLREAKQLLGKYTAENQLILPGMMFYEGMLIDEETYQTYPEFKLQADQLAYMVTGSQVSKLRGSLVTDRYLDLYVTLQLPKQTAVIDCLLRQVRIIGIKDQKGLNITETKSTGIPYVVILAVDEAYLNYLKKAEAMGSVELHLTRKQGHEECVLASDSTVLPYLQ